MLRFDMQFLEAHYRTFSLLSNNVNKNPIYDSYRNFIVLL